MASRIVTKLILAAAEPVVRTIRKGKPLAMVVGALAGGALGACNGLVMVALRPFFGVVGAIVGATVTAALFKRPPSSLGCRASDAQPFRLGAVSQSWTFEDGDFKGLTVLLEHALYVVRQDKAPWDDVLKKLERGEDPDLPLGDLIRVDELTRIEMSNAQSIEVQVFHSPAGRNKRRPVPFRTTDERDKFIAALERHFGKTLSWTQCSLGFPRTIRLPALLAVLTGALFGAVAWLSAYWTSNPPPPPMGKTEQDALVRLLVSVGPNKILLMGACLFAAMLGWLVIRTLRPPQIYVIQISEG